MYLFHRKLTEEKIETRGAYNKEKKKAVGGGMHALDGVDLTCDEVYHQT